MGKDVIYSMLNSDWINWRKLLYGQIEDNMSELEHPKSTTQSHQVPCLILDDTDIPKRGKCIEWIGKIFSHLNHQYLLGFKALHVACWTGNTLVHLDFSLHVEMGKKNTQGISSKQASKRFSKQRNQSSHAYKRESELHETKIHCAIKMISQAVANKLTFKYILFDSWFFNKRMISTIFELGSLFITRPKLNHWKYFHKGKHYTIGELIKKYKNNKHRKYSRKLSLYYLSIPVEFGGIQLSLLLYKPKVRGAKWQILISNDVGINAIKAYEIYRTRWAIEVSFKELKQNLNYGKCQSRNFAAQIAHTTISLLTYNYLSLIKAVNEHQTIGGLFSEIKANTITPNVMVMFWGQVFEFLKKFAKTIETSVDFLIEKFIHDNDFLLFLSQIRFSIIPET